MKGGNEVSNNLTDVVISGPEFTLQARAQRKGEPAVNGMGAIVVPLPRNWADYRLSITSWYRR